MEALFFVSVSASVFLPTERKGVWQSRKSMQNDTINNCINEEKEDQTKSMIMSTTREKGEKVYSIPFYSSAGGGVSVRRIVPLCDARVRKLPTPFVVSLLLLLSEVMSALSSASSVSLLLGVGVAETGILMAVRVEPRGEVGQHDDEGVKSDEEEEEEEEEEEDEEGRGEEAGDVDDSRGGL